ncbi:ABC transporter substrate-binding protein [Paenibacillus sp. N1-5-1-14]|uniref:ABC transporter substrate-binding protein n=1 Tax=Paenibacillus radicibacter TaxID=2972488 RepID=UPI002158F92A|nr:ABC transporter substrate-binding protein [Paenibacillus radicibacter]MCR8641663.1 ABC transporter substrate-binding protein [Paenibacillus radicibacter]
MKRMAMTALSGALLVFSLAACSGGDSKADGNSNGKKVISVAVLQADKFLQLAEQKYEQLHPDIDIQIKQYVAGESGGQGMDQAAFEKYLNTVNTEVLSGKGTDLISLENLPVNKYVEKKVLEDLSAMMKEDSSFQVDNYYANIMDAYKVNGSLFGMPTGFTLNMMLGDGAGVKDSGVKFDDKTWTWDTFKEVATKMMKDENGDGTPDKFAMTNVQPTGLLLDLLENDYKTYVDEANNKSDFDTANFKKMMQQVKAMFESKVASDKNTHWGDQYFTNWTASSVSSLILYPQSVSSGEGKVYRQPKVGEGDKGITFSSRSILGINSKSKMKKESWEFLKFLLSEEMQSSPELNGFAMNKGVVESQFDAIQDALTKDPMQLNGGKVAKPLSQVDLDSLKAMVNDAGTVSKVDGKIVNILFEEASAYFNGQKSVDEVAKMIQNRVTTYLNE